MSREIGVKVRDGNLFLTGISPDSYYMIEEEMDECEGEIRSIREKFKMMAMAHPKDLVSDGDNVLYTIDNLIDDLFSELSDITWRNCKLWILQSCVDEWKTGNLVPVEGKSNHFEYDDKGLDVKNQDVYEYLTSCTSTEKSDLDKVAQEVIDYKVKREEERKEWFGK